MSVTTSRGWLAGLALWVSLVGVSQAQDLNDQLEQAMKDAVRKVAPSVVQIVTQGGADMVVPSPKGPVFRKALGPTTGVIVASDGYVVSSAYNFINNPTNILVAVPGHAEPYVAKKIATDRSKMLTLLKIDKTGLPVPAMTPLKEIHEGQWSIALGRTLDAKRDSPPSVSVGIISALGRIWGKAIQTDAKISPVNYGGPMIDIQGRIQGILVPASPRGEDETAGFEWYDSGIGFAIPYEDVLAVVPKLKEGKDLKKGLLGISLKTADIYSALPEIGLVAKDSAAAKAGLKPGDVIQEIENHPVSRMAQIMHILGRKYEGDKIAVKFKRGNEVIAKEIELISTQSVYAHPFLGILPMRDDPRLGVEIRFVYPKSAADRAGLKEGDRIVKYGVDKNMAAFAGQKPGRVELIDFLNKQSPGTEVTLEVVRDGKEGKTETLTATLDSLAQDLAVPDKLPEKSTREKAREPLETTNKNLKPAKVDPDNRKVETGLLKKKTTTGTYWVYVPDNYNPNISYSMVVWLHPPGKNKEMDTEEFTDLWAGYCEDHNLILVGPTSDGENGWVPSEADFVLEAVRDTMTNYTIDRQRVVAHGMGIGGQMAFFLGFHHRDLIRGVATTGAVVSSPQENVNNQRLAFYLATGELDLLAKNIAESKTKLLEKKFPVTFRQINNRGREYFTEAQLRDLVFWIDTLDKQ